MNILVTFFALLLERSAEIVLIAIIVTQLSPKSKCNIHLVHHISGTMATLTTQRLTSRASNTGT